MTDNKNSLHKYAMQFGTYMGIYWILKFVLFPLGLKIPFLSLLFVMLTLTVPFIGYYYAKIYRDRICNGVISFSQGLFFSIFLYLFASMLVAVAHYVYFQFIDNGFVLTTYIQVWNDLAAQTPDMESNKQIISKMIETARSLTPIDITIQLVSWDFFWGSILAIPTALAVMKKK